jgi:hypothetical protein
MPRLQTAAGAFLCIFEKNGSPMLLTVEGIYQDGQIYLNDKIPFETEKKVIVTFLEDVVTAPEKSRLTPSNFSFAKTREALNNFTGSFSDEVIRERRDSL